MYIITTRGITLCMLLYFTVTDIRSGQIPWPVTIIAGVAGVLVHLLWAEPVLACFWGILPGLLLLFISRFCGEAVGRGDCYTLAACGALQGFTGAFELLFLSLAFASAWAVLLLLRKKGGLKQRFPFMPFMLTAQVCLLLK